MRVLVIRKRYNSVKEAQGDTNLLRLLRADVIKGASYSGYFIPNNPAKCSRT